MSDKRLIELEIKVAYQDDLLEALNESLGEQQKQIIRLEEVGRILAERIRNVAEPGGGINQGLEVPPHY